MILGQYYHLLISSLTIVYCQVYMYVDIGYYQTISIIFQYMLLAPSRTCGTYIICTHHMLKYNLVQMTLYLVILYGLYFI